MNIADLGIVSVPAIVVLVFAIAELVKVVGFLGDKWIPAFCGISGSLIGLAAYFVMPDYPATDIITALAVGAVSGFAATGVHQVYKQLSKDE